MLVVLVFFGERMPRSWFWLALAFFAANTLLAFFPLLPSLFFTPLVVAPWAILGIIAVWAVVDGRPAMALAIYTACMFVVSHLISYVGYGYAVLPELVAPAAIAGLLACGSFWRMRRQAVL